MKERKPVFLPKQKRIFDDDGHTLPAAVKILEDASDQAKAFLKRYKSYNPREVQLAWDMAMGLPAAMATTDRAFAAMRKARRAASLKKKS